MLENLSVSKRYLPFSENPRSEIVKNPKIFLVDLGLRNALINNFSTERSDIGAMYENLIFPELLKSGVKLNFWQTNSCAEVDFILNKEQIEIKRTPKVSKALRSFIKKFSPSNAFVISEMVKESIEIEKTEIKFLLFSKFI